MSGLAAMSTRRALQIAVPVDALVLVFALLSATRPDWVGDKLDALWALLTF